MQLKMTQANTQDIEIQFTYKSIGFHYLAFENPATTSQSYPLPIQLRQRCILQIPRKGLKSFTKTSQKSCNIASAGKEQTDFRHL